MGEIRTPEVQAIVNIDGEKVSCIRLKIEQEMAQHQDFEVLVDYRTFNETFHESPDKFLKKTNTKVVIDIQHADQPGNAYVFAGMIDNIRMISEEGAHGAILFKGKSSTIELERGEMMQTYSNTNLQTIFQEVTGGTLNLSTVIQPTWKSDIDFTMQYRESDWTFILRTCDQYKEPIYYTGTDLVIGKHKDFPTTNLTYDKELRRFEVCSRLVPNQFSTYYYKRDEHKVLEQDSPGSIDGANDLLNIVGKRSDNLNLGRKPNTPTEAFIPDMGSLIDHTKRRKVSTGGRMMYVRGECKTCDVRIGRKISVSQPSNLGGELIGTFRVYSAVHEFDQAGHYKCKFEAIPADLEYIPTPHIHIPTPNLIQAEVWDNEDPEGMGRVKVQFPFDEKPCGIWIPVMTPDAGGKDLGLGPASRGYSFIPEKSDTVAISFLDGSQLCHPVVVGSMFHGKNAENLGGGKNNYIKTIRTKSGHTFKLDDTKGEEKIQLYDYRGNIVEIDTPSDIINVSTDGTINLRATNINLFAKNAITETAGVVYAASAGKTASVTGGDSAFINAGKDAAIKAGKNFSAQGGKKSSVTSGINSEMTLDSKGKATLKGKKAVDVSSKEKVKIVGIKQTTVASKKMSIEGKTKTDIKGRQIDVG